MEILRFEVWCFLSFFVKPGASSLVFFFLLFRFVSSQPLNDVWIQLNWPGFPFLPPLSPGFWANLSQSHSGSSAGNNFQKLLPNGNFVFASWSVPWCITCRLSPAAICLHLPFHLPPVATCHLSPGVSVSTWGSWPAPSWCCPWWSGVRRSAAGAGVQEHRSTGVQM